ncbi:MAG TPA: DUF3291 domain-containing protein, partial [Sphingomonadaceae bacterium]|nr:DUF3291 domain-containing protein [Sphingomonadaceae bacterium]
AHTQIMAKRRQWFERTDSAYMALWWIEDGRRPTVEEGLAKLWLIDRFGPTVHAFGFKSVFPAPDKAGSPADHHTDLRCVGNI